MYFRRHTLSLPGRIFGLLTNKGPLYMSTQVSQGSFGQVRSTRHQVDCDRTQKTQQGQGVQDRETAQLVRRLANQVSAFWTRRSVPDQGNSYRDPTETNAIVWRFPRDRHQSQPRSSSASTRVHLEECNPPYRQVHEVRKAKKTVRSTRSVSVESWGLKNLVITARPQDGCVRLTTTCALKIAISFS